MRALLLAVLIGAALVISEANAAGNAQYGRTIAQNRCSSCHVVEPNQKGGDTAPPFAEIARKHANDMSWVRTWLTDPHPPMQGIALSREEIDDIVAFLQSLPKQ
ncbi:MAG TPA: cytochrome c [Stellaceae bacterium]|nr:cytochrome c [Stellaceae bacterium]